MFQTFYILGHFRLAIHNCIYAAILTSFSIRYNWAVLGRSTEVVSHFLCIKLSQTFHVFLSKSTFLRKLFDFPINRTSLLSIVMQTLNLTASWIPIICILSMRSVPNVYRLRCLVQLIPAAWYRTSQPFLNFCFSFFTYRISQSPLSVTSVTDLISGSALVSSSPLNYRVCI